MDLAEATQRIAWLDEMRRADQQSIADLLKQVDGQTAMIADLSRRLETLTVELARARGELSRVDQLELALAQSRDELRARLADETSAREAAEARARERHTAQAAVTADLSRSVQDLQDEVSQAQARLAYLPARVDEQVTQAGTLAREVEDLESRLTRAQGQAAGLDGRLSQQTEQVAQLLRQLQGLEGRLSQTQTQLVRFPQIEEALAKAKAELTGLIKEQEARRREEMAAFAQARQHERDVDRQAVTALGRQLEVLPRLQERLQAIAAEQQRIGEVLPHLDARDAELAMSIEDKTGRLPFIEERLRRETERSTALEQQASELAASVETRLARLAYVDEQVARDTGRIAVLERTAAALEKGIQDRTVRIPLLAELIDGNTERLDAIEPEIVEARRRSGEMAEKIRFLEGWAQRTAEKIGEIAIFEARIEESHDRFLEQAQFADAARIRQAETWIAELADHRQRLDAWAQELKRYAEMYEWARTTTLAVEELGAQLTRQQHEVEERLRLEGEKQKKALEDWEAEWTKQWGIFMKGYEWKWNEQAKLDRQQIARTEQVEAWRQQDVARADGLAARLEEQDKIQLQRVADVWQVFESYARLRQGELKKWLDELEQARNQSMRNTSRSPKSQIQAPKVGPESAERR